MRHEKIVPGTILIGLGIIFLLNSFGVVHIDWFNILYLWPIFLLIAGINLIFAHNRTVWASILKIGVVLLGLCILLFGGISERYNFWPGHYYYHGNNNDRDDDDDDDNDNGGKSIVKISGNSTFNEPFHPDARYAKLNINDAGTAYTLSDTTGQLFQAFTKENSDTYEYSHTVKDSLYTLNFEMKDREDHHIRWFRKGRNNLVNLKLNSAPIWDIEIATGATKFNFDLTKFKIRNFKIDGGMADFYVKLGQPLDSTNVDISIGMAKVKINVPKDAACRIDSDTGLSENRYNGFTKMEDGRYETPGFSAAKKKIFIKMDGAAAHFEVNRY